MFAWLACPIGLLLTLGPACGGAQPHAPSLPRSKESVAPTTPEVEPDAGAGASEAPRPIARDINHVLVGGQSLAVGVAGAPPLSLTQPYANLMFNTGVIAGSDELDHFEPLVEGDNIPGSKAVIETMSSGFANLVSELSISDGAPRHDLLMSVHASGAKHYTLLKRGTKPYAAAMAQVTAAASIAEGSHKSYAVRAVLIVHGESDHAEKNDHYDRDLREWQSDYERDIRALSKQAEPVPMFHSQMSSFTRMMKGTETSEIPGAQLRASTQSNGKIILVGPKYHLPYAKDGVHLTAQGYRHMGEDYAKAYRRVVLEGKTWEPLRPASIRRDGATLVVKFLVPSPPLVLDTKNVLDPGDFGFEYTDSSAAPPAIAKVEISGEDAVTITLAREPTGTGARLRYAFTGHRGLPSGPQTGARGNLRDSDSTRSRSGYALYNWCVHFDEPIP